MIGATQYITKLGSAPFLGGLVQVINTNMLAFITHIKEHIIAHNYYVKEANSYTIKVNHYDNLIPNEYNDSCIRTEPSLHTREQ